MARKIVATIDDHPFMLTHDGRTISERADQLGLLAGATP